MKLAEVILWLIDPYVLAVVEYAFFVAFEVLLYVRYFVLLAIESDDVAFLVRALSGLFVHHGGWPEVCVQAEQDLVTDVFFELVFVTHIAQSSRL